MNAEHFSRIRELFARATELPAAEREAFVRAEAGDESIAAEVLRLLGLDEQPEMHTAQGMQVMAAAEAAPLPQGRRIGKYELFDVLGEGGMGQVYRARRVDGPEHWVALKLMRRGLFSGASESRFLAEQQFLARLNHAGIAHYIDSGTDADGNVFVAMELVQGQRLRDYAKSRDLNVKQRVELFRQLLAAVSYAHRQLVIHRDLKQANVLVTDEGQVKLLDFGIAKLLQDQPEMTGTRERLYTPTCAAPEQIRGELCDVTTDVYALGVLLYELIAGKSIFDTEGKTPGEFENLVLNVPPPDMRSRLDSEFGAKDIPADLERIVAKAIRKEPNRRYTSVEQFDADLERLLANEPVSVSGNGWLYRTQKFLSRNRLASALTAATVLAILVGFAITLQQNREIRAERDRANLALDAMKQAFLGADPGGEAGGEVSARDILEKSTDNLMPLLKNGDKQFVDLAAVLMEVQISMGLIKDAQLLSSSLDEELIQSDPELCLLTARIASEVRDFPLFDQRIVRCNVTDERQATLREMTVARANFMRRKYKLAASEFEAVRFKLPVDSPDWITSVQMQVNALRFSNLPAEAAETVEQAIEVASRTLPADHVTLARLEISRIQALCDIEDTPNLLVMAPKWLSSVRARFGNQSMVVARAESVIADALVLRNDLAAAMPHLEQAFQIGKSVYGSDNAETLQMEANVVTTRARLTPNAPEVQSSFESLIVRADRPDLEIFRNYLLVDYGRWLGKQGQIEAALRILASVNQERLRFASSDVHETYNNWLNYSYWVIGCAEDPTDRHTRNEACQAFPRLDNLCLVARDAICFDRRNSPFNGLWNKSQ